MKTSESAFNSALETGVRALTILEACFPNSIDVQRLVELDYLVVHSGDAGGPESLHAPLPLRSGELLVRREVIANGLALMISRGLVKRIVDSDGISYLAAETVTPFLGSLSSKYIHHLQDRAAWAANHFGDVSHQQLREITSDLFKSWTSQFQAVEKTGGSEN